MRNDDFLNPCSTDLETWLLDDEVQHKIFRMWLKSDPNGAMCNYVYLTHFIELPNKKMLIGVQPCDEENKDSKHSNINYHMLDDISFSYHSSDNMPADEDER